MTRNNIIYDLRLSMFKYKLNNIEYVFSSQLHRDKFIARYEDNRKKLSHKLTEKYSFNISHDIMADLLLYEKVETRGFLIYNERGKELCKENLILNGEKVTLKN